MTEAPQPQAHAAYQEQLTLSAKKHKGHQARPLESQREPLMLEPTRGPSKVTANRNGFNNNRSLSTSMVSSKQVKLVEFVIWAAFWYRSVSKFRISILWAEEWRNESNSEWVVFFTRSVLPLLNWVSTNYTTIPTSTALLGLMKILWPKTSKWILLWKPMVQFCDS